MAKTKITGRCNSYIFDGAGGMRDQLEQSILSELEAKQYPLKATIKQIKAGGLFFGTKEQCVVIDVDKETQIAISNTTVGTYLYVAMYILVRENLYIFSSISLYTSNMFKQQKRDAVYAAAKETVESAFNKLELKQSNFGYKFEKQDIDKSQ